MKALTVEPRVPGTVRLEEWPQPQPADGDVIVDGLAIGICGTDHEIIAGVHGAPPPGRARIVLGHEALGRVSATSASARGSALSEGDHVVPMVRRPDPVPCPACAAGEFDMCANGQYLEHGIKQLDGFACERWAVPADRLVALPPVLATTGVLVEPTSVVAKAWEQIDRLERRVTSGRSRVLVTGAGPIGLLAALLATQRGHDVHVLDRVTDGPKPQLVADLGATYHRDLGEAAPGADIVVECTGAAEVVLGAIEHSARNGIVCLTGLTTGGRTVPVDVGAVNRNLVLENDVVFGSVSANRRHYEQAVAALAAAEQRWLSRLITRRQPLDGWADAVAEHPDDVKVVVDLR